MSQETAAHLDASLGSVWLITSTLRTALHVVLALPGRLMSARHQAASPESALPHIPIRRTARHVLTRHLNAVSLPVARREAAFRITRLKIAVAIKVVRRASGRLTPTRSKRMPGQWIQILS